MRHRTSGLIIILRLEFFPLNPIKRQKMSLNYDKSNRHESSTDSMWTTYSDLFMMLAVLFLMMYVIANLRSNTASLQGRVEYQRLTGETEDLRQQNKVYEALKQDYLASQASQSEVKVYEDLMNKLSLLRDKAKDEKEELRKQSDENEAKELALNHYQQMIRNIINANVVAKAKLISRDEVIDKKRQEIAEKEQIIATNNEEIRDTRENLEKRINELRKNEKNQKISKVKMDKEIASLRMKSDQKIAVLKAQSENVESQLTTVSQELAQTKTNLEATKTDLESTENKLQQESIAKAKLGAELVASKAKYEDATEGLKAEFEAKAAADKAAFDKELATTKLSAKARADKEKAFADQLKGDKDKLSAELAALDNKFQQTEKDLAASQDGLKKAEQEKTKFKEYVATLEEQKKDLSGDLAVAKRQLRDKKKLADKIKSELSKAGIESEVDAKSGEVIVAFGKEYFDTGKFELKPSMEKTIKKFIPLYSKSLFSDKKISDRIASVDLIGFASPTYAGKYVDPQSLKEQDREAVQYNLDLSYKRAKSIFNYVFDTKKMKFADQKRLLGLIKVSGRSFLHQEIQGKDVESGVAVKEFCAKHDCLKEQKVIIKFNLKD